MAVLIGHASISENGTINGAKGDSTGKEVCTRNWYNKPWDYMAIHPDPDVRERHARAIEQACANNNIGYGQNDRNTLNTQAKAVGYDLSKIKTKCNCDCSSLQNVAAMASGAPGVSYGSNGWTTSSMLAALKAAGYKIITASAYLTSSAYCVRGAIYVKAGSHTVCGLSNGSKASQTLSKAGATSSAGSASSSSDGILRRGDFGSAVKDMQEALIAKGYDCGPDGADGDFGANTEEALIEFQRDHGLEVDGEYGPLSKAALEGSGISSGTSGGAVGTSYDVGDVYTLQVDRLAVRAGAGTNYARKSYSQLTANARENAYSDGYLKKGTRVTCKATKKVGSDIWIQIPSGWVAAYYNGKSYIA